MQFDTSNWHIWKALGWRKMQYQWDKRMYVTDKGCMALCVDNMRRVQELSPIELVEMFVTVFCFLKDSSDVSQVLLDDFRSYKGYNFLAEFLLK